MKDFHSDYETIKALQELTKLIQQGLNDAWDPKIIDQAKQKIEATVSNAIQKVDSIKINIQQIEANLKAVNLQKTELEETIEVANRLDQLIQELGGANKLQQNLEKLVHLDELLNEISNGREVAKSLQQQTQNLQEITTSLIKKIDHLGGTNTLIEKFNQVQEIAKKLDTVDFQIQSNIDSCLNNYLPEFEAGKLQIEQWRNNVLLETRQTLEKINGIYESINKLFKKTDQNCDFAKITLKEFDRKETELRTILNSITELTKSLGGENLVVNATKKLTNLENFILSEKSNLNNFTRELEKTFDKSFMEIADKNEEVFKEKIDNINSFISSTKSQINTIQNQLKSNLKGEFQGLANVHEEMIKKNTNILKKELQNEFQNLLKQEIDKLETKYLQQIHHLDEENKRLKNSHFKLMPWK
ncbi:MAG: hypothetical protein VKJ02_11735 [Snowella sp.]|nr:hypothetical protein [Snowella sp.]